LRSTWRRLVAIPLGFLLATCAPHDTQQMGSVCTPGQQRCDGNAYETCSDHGNQWVIDDDCAQQQQVCVLGIGCLNCVPNQLDCGGDGEDIVLCSADGSRLDTVGRCDPEMGQICAAGVCEDSCTLANQTRSYEGCEYWAVDLDNADVTDLGAAAAQQYAVVVSNPDELPATVTVEENEADPGQPPQITQVAQAHLSRVVGGGDLAIIKLPPREVDGSSDPRLNDGPGTWLSSRAYHIRSTAPIVAYQFNPLDNVDVFSNGASLLLPAPALDTDYVVMGWPETIANTADPTTNEGIDLRAFLTIVGQTDGTHVTVKLATDIVGGGPVAPSKAGDTLQLTLGPYDVLNLESTGFNSDFTGSLVSADQAVTVFSGSEASDVPWFTTTAKRQCCADHLEMELFPTTALGTDFIAVETPNRETWVNAAGWMVGQSPMPEYWRILATVDDTHITTTLPPPNVSFTLQAGTFAEIEAYSSFAMHADEPVEFAQFPVSQEAAGIPTTVDGTHPAGGDPDSMIIPPVQQWRSKYLFLTPNTYAFDFMLFAMPDDSSIELDGEDIQTAIPDCEYEPIGAVPGGDKKYVGVRCPLSHPMAADPNNPLYQNDGPHLVESSDGQPFGLVVFGWDSYVSYGYPGGTNVKIINPK
jgi:hypothetical protein